MQGFIHGINIGGWLSQCEHTKTHYDTFICEKDFATIKSWGLDHVRIPVDYNLVQNNDGIFLQNDFIYIDNAIAWCKKHGLNMILDLHKTIGYSFDEGEKEAGFFESEKYQNMFYELWKEFAKRYAKYNDMLCFELLNEVTDKEYCKTWNKIAKKCIENIRNISSDVKILVGSYWNNHVRAVRDLDAPYDKNIVYNFHCYEPVIFTHQGASWISEMDTSFRMKLSASFKQYDEWTRKNINQKGDDFSMYDENATIDETYFENLFNDAIKVAKERGVELYCGEYGVIDFAEPAEALAWYKLINSVFEKHNIGRAVWSYKKMNFGISDKWLDDVRSKVLKLL